jgi:hypothetical protein
MWDSPSSLNSGQVAVCGTRGKDAIHGGTLLSMWDSPSSLNSGQIAVCGTRGKDAIHGGNSVEHVDDSLVIQ